MGSSGWTEPQEGGEADVLLGGDGHAQQEPEPRGVDGERTQEQLEINTKVCNIQKTALFWGMVCITSNIAFPRNINWKTKNVLRPYPIMKRNQPTQESFFDR